MSFYRWLVEEVPIPRYDNILNSVLVVVTGLYFLLEWLAS